MGGASFALGCGACLDAVVCGLSPTVCLGLVIVGLARAAASASFNERAEARELVQLDGNAGSGLPFLFGVDVSEARAGELLRDIFSSKKRVGRFP